MGVPHVAELPHRELVHRTAIATTVEDARRGLYPLVPLTNGADACVCFI